MTIEERAIKDGYYVRLANYKEVEEFAKHTCEEDLHECEVAFGIPRDKLAWSNWMGASMGCYIASLNNEDVVLIGLDKLDDNGCARVFMQSHNNLSRNKMKYVRWCKFTLVNLCKFFNIKEIDAVCWSKHRVCKTIERLLGAVCVEEFDELKRYVLVGVIKEL